MSSISGIFRAQVVRNNDPLGMSRVTLRVPQILGAQETSWAEPHRVNVTAPYPGDQVFMFFAGNDPEKPVYLG